MAQQTNSFGFLKGSGSGGGGTNTNIANTDLTQDDNRTLTGDGNDLIFTGQALIETNSELNIKNGTNAPDIRIFEASGSGTNYVKLTIDAVSANRTIKFPISADTTLAGLALRQTFTDRNIVNIREFEVTTSTDGDCIGDIVYFGSTSVTAGVCYYLTSAGAWAAADRRTEAASIGFLGVACGTGTASAVGMCIRGMITMSTDTGDVGDVLWLRINGAFENAIPTSSGEYVRVVGYCMDDNDGQVFFNPSQDWTEIA